MTATAGSGPYFTLSPVAGVNAGTKIPDVTVTAYLADGFPDINYAGPATLSTNLNGSSTGCSGPCGASGGSLSSWVQGVATITGAIGYKAESGRTLTVTDGTTTGTTSFNVVHAATLGGLTIDPIGNQVAGTSFSVVTRAFDVYGNPKLDQAGGSFSGLVASPGCSDCAPAVAVASASHGTIVWSGDGVGTASVTAVDADTAATLTVTDGTTTGTTSFNVVHAATLGGLTIDPIGNQVAGTSFSVVTRAFDVYGNPKLDQAGGSFSGLVASPGCSDCAPAVAVAQPVHGALSWSAGVGTAAVTAKNAQSLASLTVTDGLVANGSSAFTVNPGTASRLVFKDASVGFNGQPTDAMAAQPIDSVCGPYVFPDAPASANPCAPATSTGTKVLALDVFGNRVGGVAVTVTSSPSGVTGGAAVSTQGGTPGVAPYGEAVFSNLRMTLIGSNRTLTALATAVSPATSQAFRIVNDLEACDGTLCDNNTTNALTTAKLQRAFGKITTGADFFTNSTNVRLTTQFVSGTETNKCSNITIGDATDLQVAGLGTGSTAPNTTMVMVLPKDALKAYNIASRGTTSFNVCLGALNISGNDVSAWQQKDTKKGGLLKPSVPLGVGSELRYWGVPADCGTAGLAASDPCIGLRTKQAATVRAYLGLTTTQFATLGIRDSDLVIIIQKQSPWDGKGGVY